jgi:organic radical activating enzyme
MNCPTTTSPTADLPLGLSDTLPIVETFHSIQGEGAWAGTNAFFIRLAGCDVGCPWCDTKQSWNLKRHPPRQIGDLVAAAKAVSPKIVVITGGEPLMHDLTALTQQLKNADLQVHLETSGAHPFSGIFDWVPFSPKRFKPPHPSISPQTSELTGVVADESDLAWAEQQAAQLSPSVDKRLQPEWETSGSQQIVFNFVLRHPGWRVSLQTHKFLGVQ